MNIKSTLVRLMAIGLLFVPEFVGAQKTPEASVTSADSAAETLSKQLAAQLAINQQLKKRVDALEQELASNRKSVGPLIVGLDTNAPAARDIAEAADAPISAIEEALIEKGLVLLPTGNYRFTPSVAWGHNGQASNRVDSYSLGMSLEVGLPAGMSVAFRQPYLWIDREASGSRDGSGHFSVSLAKKLNNETESIPSFVARLGYTHDNGDASVTSGFKTYSAGISAVKRADPLVFYGSASYAHQPTETFYSSGDWVIIKRADSYGLDFGVSLAATPEVSLDAGLSFGFAGRDNAAFSDGSLGRGHKRSEGYINLGTGIRLTKSLFLSVSAAAGVTSDASDFIFSVALPYRF